jgi:hypothetical protein
MIRITTLSALGCLFVAGTSYGQDIYNAKATAAGPIFQEPTTEYTDNRWAVTTEVNFGGGCYWYDEDVDVKFDIPGGSGIPGYDEMTSATITLVYFDVDFLDQSVWNAELDVVGIGVDNVYAVDVLKGRNGTTRMTKIWDVFCQIQCAQSDSIGFQINIDAAHDYHYWCLGLDSVTFTTKWTNNFTVAPACMCSSTATEAASIVKSGG